ncbi:MAG: hypothetical protein ACRDTH_29260 [Pseudonocardiaceae bacterium]
MDGVALASVIVSGAAVIATSSVAFWTTRQSAKLARESARESAKLARETRVQQRLAESYLEVLRIVEREAQWFEARITNLKIAVVEADLEPNPEARTFLARRKRMKMPDEPAVTDRAIVAAHLAAFGSDNVRRLHLAWRSAIAEIGLDLAVLDTIADDYQEGQEHPVRYLSDLIEKLHPNELSARQALADAIAEELGHR